MPLLDFSDDVPMVDCLPLVSRWRGEEMKEIVSLPRRGLGGAARGDLGRGHMIDYNLEPVFRPPLFRKNIIEPPVVARHVVAPLDDPQRLPARHPPPARNRQRPRRQRGASASQEATSSERSGQRPSL